MNPVHHASASSSSLGHHDATSHSASTATEPHTSHNRLVGSMSVAGTATTDVATHPSAEATTSEARNFVRLNLPAINTQLPLEQRAAEVRRLAVEAFPQCDNWVLFYREIFGVDGVLRKLFTTVEELKTWESSPEFYETHEMLAALRSQDNGKGDTIEPSV